jgi:hypothetical protein
MVGVITSITETDSFAEIAKRHDSSRNGPTAGFFPTCDPDDFTGYSLTLGSDVNATSAGVLKRSSIMAAQTAITVSATQAARKDFMAGSGRVLVELFILNGNS